MLITTLILFGLIISFWVVGIILQASVERDIKNAQMSYCKKDECDSCPFPPCDEKGRKKNTGE